MRLAGGKRRIRKKLSAQKMKAKQLSARMKARARLRRERDVDIVYETPITLRSKFAWITIVLMVLVIVAASIRVHPAHFRVEYVMTETGENPYMGTLDAEGGYLVSARVSWAEAEPVEGEYALPGDMPLLEGGLRYVLILDAEEAPGHVRQAAAGEEDAQSYTEGRLRQCVSALCRLMSERGDCAYLQTDAALTDMSACEEGIYILCLAGDGLYRSPEGGDGSWVDAPVAGTGEQIFGNHLTYVLSGGDGEALHGRVGWALGVRYAEWHSFTRTGDRLFVNMTVDNAGVIAPYRQFELVLTLWRGDEVYAREVQQVDLRELKSEPVDVGGYIDIPYDIEKGVYSLCVSVCEPGCEQPAMSLTMPHGEEGYYELGRVSVR